MNNNAEEIKRRFDRSASGSYDKHAHIQRAMADWLIRSLESRLGTDAGAPKILEIGCGTGLLTARLRDSFPSAAITALDLSPAMLEAAKKRAGAGAASIRFEAGNVEEWAAGAASGSFDLIVSNACFQWLNKPQDTMAELKRILRPGGLLSFTTFGPETFRELHCSFGEAYRSMGLEPERHGLSFLPAEEWEAVLRKAGFPDFSHEREIRVECYATVKDFLKSVKATGAGASQASGASPLPLRGLFAGMFRIYEEKYAVPGGVGATYDLRLIHAVIDPSFPK